MISIFQFQPGGSAVESARIGADYIHRSGAQHIGCIRSEVHQGAHKGEWKNFSKPDVITWELFEDKVII